MTVSVMETGLRILNFLYIYRQVNIERCYESDLIPKLLDGISYKDLLSLTDKTNQNQAISIAMIAHGILTFDQSKLLNPLTYLEFNHDKYRAI